MVDPLTALAIRQAKNLIRDNVEANMTSTILITRQNRADAASIDSAGEISVTAEQTIYEGVARLHNASGPVTYTIGEEVQFYSSGTATVPLDVDSVPLDVWVNDVLHVTGSDDPVMVGRKFRVVDVEVAGVLAVGRRLQLVGIQRYAGWVDDVVRHPLSGDVPDGVPPEWSV